MTVVIIFHNFILKFPKNPKMRMLKSGLKLPLARLEIELSMILCFSWCHDSWPLVLQHCFVLH
jgi:hypothetical protein